MRKSLIQLMTFALFIFVSGTALAQNISYNNLFERASRLQEGSLPQKGRHSCKQSFSVDPYGVEGRPVQSFANSVEQAQEDLYVVCIKRKCDSLGFQVSAEMQLMQSMSRDELSGYLQSMGIAKEEVSSLVAKIKSASSSQGRTVSCQSVSLPLRVQLMDLCLNTPVECQ
ncbi:hypothetical protein [Bdellovibrio sp. HCB2-146]|uniref:hypothetical protein n=1 Tax=Bdellovibrio sp. HCB2-146 TaxID=3394362 RepID=UPI0039BD4318